MKNKEHHHCLYCNKLLNNNYNKFCNFDCHIKYKWQQEKLLIEQMQNFQINGINELNARRKAKKYLIEKYGNVCSICETTHWLGKPIMLIADHIDGDATNNSINNIRLICSNCDATLDTYKAKNKSTRKNRK